MARQTSLAADSTRPLNFLFAFVFLLLSVAGLWLMRIETAMNDIPVNFIDHVEKAKLEDGTPLKTTFTGISAIDTSLAMLGSAFLAGPLGLDKGVRLQQMHFLLNFFAVLCIWNVESCRTRNRYKAIGVMIPWTLLFQIVGGAIIIPLFYLASVIGSNKNGYFNSGREVPLSYAQAILPSALLLYLVPTLAMYFPWNNIELTQNITAFWQPAPTFVNFLILALSLVLSRTTKTKSSSARGTDIKHLNRIYLSVFLVTTITHITVLFICFTSTDPKLSLSYVFLPSRQTYKSTTTLGLHYIFQWDAWGIFLSSLIWCWMSVSDVQRILKHQSVGGELKTGVLLTIGSVLAGPGAVMSIVWWWREAKLEEIERTVDKSKAT